MLTQLIYNYKYQKTNEYKNIEHLDNKYNIDVPN